MEQYKQSIEQQRKIFLSLILKNKNIKTILDRGFVDGIKDWYLVAGCLNQTMWNQFTNRSLENEISDYDLIYFDTDTSWEKEDKIIKAVQKKFKDLKINIDIKNQARVHLWIDKNWNLKMRPLTSCEDAIASWPITASCIGIRKENGKYKIVAPYGLTDNLEMVLRPNKTTVMRESDYNYKTNKWLKKWPELKLITW